MSGSEITTFGFPPNADSFDAASPIVLETDKLPGKTR